MERLGLASPGAYRHGRKGARLVAEGDPHLDRRRIYGKDLHPSPTVPISPPPSPGAPALVPRACSPAPITSSNPSAREIHASPRASKPTQALALLFAPVEADDEGVGPIERLGRLPPLDEHHPALFELLFEGEIDHLLQVLEPPKIDMGDRRGRLVAVGEGEGGTRDPFMSPECRHEALDELACPPPSEPTRRRTSPPWSSFARPAPIARAPAGPVVAARLI